MSKKKSKHARARQASPSVRDAPQIPHVAHVAHSASSASSASSDWERVEAEFFARESELYQISPVENFDDLDKDG